MTTIYRVCWDNGADACGTFSERFESYDDADAYGREWASECNIRDFGTDEPDDDCYTYDVIEEEAADDEEEAGPDPGRDGWVDKNGRP
jgi:hypothetical protein